MITGDLQRTIAELIEIVAQMDVLEEACDLACERLQIAFDTPVAILERAGARWRLRSGASTASVPAPPEWGVDRAFDFNDEALGETALQAQSPEWAWFPLGGSDDRVMLVAADWQPQAAFDVADLIRQLGNALGTVAARERARRPARLLRTTHKLARRLAAVHDEPGLSQLIVDETARATRANLAALALFSESEGHLRVAATRGYSHVLVEDVRVLPGEGVIGTVFSTRRPLLVSDVALCPHVQQPRPRYRTASFVAVPILNAGQSLGVLCLTDRADGAPFETSDLRTVRALAAPAALALKTAAVSKQAEMLGEWASVDPLTGLFNRRYLLQRLEEELRRAKRHHLPISILLLDLDNFKRINDAYGHVAGDSVLRTVSDILRRSVRGFDVCCRYGGEEFAVLLPGTDAASSLATADRVREAIGTVRLSLNPEHAPLQVTVSIGAMTLGQNDTVDTVIAEADSALYEAKRAGKNQIRIAPDPC